MFITLLVLPLVCAFVSWLSVRSVIYFLFYPLRPVRVLGIEVQGALWVNRADIATYVGEAVAAELKTSGKSFISSVTGAESLQAVNPMIAAHLDSFLRVKLKEKMPVIAAFIGESTIVKLKEGMMEEITLLLPEVITSYSGTLVAHPAISTYIAKRINALPPDAIVASFPPQFRRMFTTVPLWAALLGGVLGALIAIGLYLIGVV
jgi:hypothetical protein